MSVFFVPRAMFSALLVFFFVSISASSQSTPNVPEQYKRLFFEYSDRGGLEKVVNKLGMTTLKVGRSFALIAGVAQYPNLPVLEQSLKPAAVDIEKLKSYLRDQEYFDEIVVLKDGDMNLNNLNYFLQSYFPERLADSPHARFLFAYSGHGYADGEGEMARGFLLTSTATSKTDTFNRIDLNLLRTMLDPVVDSAEKVLVLVNACQSGAFLGRKTFGMNPLGPGDRGAHAIMASRVRQASLQLDKVGPGSVFFEKILAGLDGVADTAPHDGVVTYHELDNYLRSEIPYATDGAQIPMEGDISRNGSVGEFFFLNRSRQLQEGNSKPWDPGNAVKFGEQANDVMYGGLTAYTTGHFDQAVQAFLQAAAAGNADAMAYLGDLYFEGRGVPQDYQEARGWFERGSSAGSAMAMTGLGTLYDSGNGVKQDHQRARDLFEKAAGEGYALAMTDLGVQYENGYGVRQDYGQAVGWYRRAASVGSSTAMRYLGNLYEDGDGVDQNSHQAHEWYEKAAAAGDTIAMRTLGSLYENADGVKPDYEQARNWYEKAAESGDSIAMRYLGDFYWEGKGVRQDVQQARDWYEKAAAGGDTSAMTELGDLYEGGNGMDRNSQEAQKWYEKAAAAGDDRAMVALGNLYFVGTGVAQDYQLARQWFEKAATAGDTMAMSNLGALYEQGNGVKRDYSLARQWFEKAAAGGSRLAMANLGVLYQDGEGVKKDYKQARQWYEKAVQERGTSDDLQYWYSHPQEEFVGRGQAMASLGALYANGRGVKRDYQQARQWFERAAAAGDSGGMFDMGILYENGDGVPRDNKQARYWYGKAASAGSSEAETRLRTLPN